MVDAFDTNPTLVFIANVRFAAIGVDHARVWGGRLGVTFTRVVDARLPAKAVGIGETVANKLTHGFGANKLRRTIAVIKTLPGPNTLAVVANLSI